MRIAASMAMAPNARSRSSIDSALPSVMRADPVPRLGGSRRCASEGLAAPVGLAALPVTTRCTQAPRGRLDAAARPFASVARGRAGSVA
jgi:hypothetical protein